MTTKTRPVARALVGGASALALMFTAACGGDGADSPEDLGKETAKVLTEQDVEAAKKLTCEAKKDSVADKFDMAKDLPPEYKDVKPVAEFVGVENATDDSATIKLKLKLENLPPEAAQLGLDKGIDIPVKAIKEDGNWVICE